MQISVFVLLSVLPALGLTAPADLEARSATRASTATGSRSTSGAAASAAASGSSSGNTGGNGVTDTQIAMAVELWMNDTGKVSKFLDTATSFSGDEFTKQATIALNAEKDELNHKAVLDDALGPKGQVKTANDTLATQGTFQAVVDALQQMVNEGPDTAQAQVDAINQNRCVNVLPNIDAYFAAAGSASVKSVRPTGCLEVAANSSSKATGAAGTKATGAAGTKATGAAGTKASGAAGTKGSKSSKSAGAASATPAPSAAANGSTGSSGSSAKSKTTKATKTTAATATAKAANASSAAGSSATDPADSAADPADSAADSSATDSGSSDTGAADSSASDSSASTN